MSATVALWGLFVSLCLVAAAGLRLIQLGREWAARYRAARQADREARVQQQRDQRIADVNARLRRVPAAPDNTEGTRLDWHDECERLWSAPFDPQTGLELLRRDVRKQQREEES